jgi:hypothetical protein
MPNPNKIAMTDALTQWLKDNPPPFLLMLTKQGNIAPEDHERLEREMKDWQERCRIKAMKWPSNEDR